MSDLPADYAERLNFSEQIARIDRTIDEAAKFRAERSKLDAELMKLAVEQAKLSAEQTKFAAEQFKLMAEDAKLTRDRLLAPVVALVATLGAIATLVPIILRAVGR